MEHQNKSTNIQMSPKHPAPTGTQAMNKKASQVGGTQTMPPPSPKKSTSTGGTQTSPPKSNSHRQVDQGQLDCNQERQLANTTSGKGKKPRSQLPRLHPILDHLQNHMLDQDMTSHQEI